MANGLLFVHTPPPMYPAYPVTELAFLISLFWNHFALMPFPQHAKALAGRTPTKKWCAHIKHHSLLREQRQLWPFLYTASVLIVQSSLSSTNDILTTSTFFLLMVTDSRLGVDLLKTTTISFTLPVFSSSWLSLHHSATFSTKVQCSSCYPPLIHPMKAVSLENFCRWHDSVLHLKSEVH